MSRKTFDELFVQAKVDEARKGIAKDSVKLQLESAVLQIRTQKLNAERVMDSLFVSVKDQSVLRIEDVLNQMANIRDLEEAAADLAAITNDLFPTVEG